MAKPIPTQIPEDVKARFWARVDVRGPNDCWEWQGYRTPKGYGRFSERGLGGMFAHRFALHISGPGIAPDLVTDHLCRNRACVNPLHLRAVSNTMNVLIGGGHTAQNARKTHCKRGHPLSGDNVKIHRRGGGAWRRCKKCSHIARAEQIERERLARLRTEGSRHE